MAVVHRVRLIEPEFDRISTLLCFLSDDARPTALGGKYPRVVNLKTRIIDAPTDFPARLETIHRASDGKTERLPSEADTLASLDWPPSMRMSAEFEYQLGHCAASIRFVQTMPDGASIQPSLWTKTSALRGSRPCGLWISGVACFKQSTDKWPDSVHPPPKS